MVYCDKFISNWRAQDHNSRLKTHQTIISFQAKQSSQQNNDMKSEMLLKSPGKYSQISVIRTPIIRNYWVIRRRWTVPNFFSIIYCNKTANYSNFDYPKNSIFRSDSSVPIEESAIKLPFKIRSPKVTHGDHDFFVWSSSIYTPEWISKQSCNR